MHLVQVCNDRPRVVDNSPRPSPPEGGWAAWYLRDEDDVGEGTEQGITVRTLLSALRELARERDWARTLVAGDQFFAWVEHEPLVRISPDVYLLDDPPAPPYPGMWRTWLPGQAAPRFAVEVVSDDWAKDYVQAPRKYEQLGTSELIVFDPEAGRRGRRFALQLFRRDASGALVRLAAGDDPVHSRELDAWLVVHRDPGGARLRIARDPAGRELIPTTEERALALQAQLREQTSAATTARDAIADLRATIATRDATIADLRATIATRDATIADLRATIAARDATIADLRATIAARDASISDLRAAIATRDATISDLHSAIEARLAALEARPARRPRRT